MLVRRLVIIYMMASAIVMLLWPFTIHANIYSWVGENGTVSFSDNPMSVPENKQAKTQKIYTSEDSISSINPLRASYDYPKILETIDYYDIAGVSETELRRQMDTNGYLCEDGKRYAGVTAWRVRWVTFPRKNRESCAVNKIEAFVDVNFRLPRWINRITASPDVQNWWILYYNSLLKHENGHRDMAVEAAREIQSKIAEVTPHKTCTELLETANTVGNEVLAKYIKLQRDYDTRTKNGKQQDKATR